MGAFSAPRDLDQDGFFDWLARLDHAEFFILEAVGEKGMMPVGFVAVTADGEIPHVVYPHVEWFPWATVRNRIEAAIGFINALRRDFLLLIRVKQDVAKFYEHITKYGILQVMGRLPCFYAYDLSPENTSIIFRSRKPNVSR